MKHRAWAEINLDVAAENMRNIRKVTNSDAQIMAVVKADAYGHGFLEMSKVFLDNGADRLAVATIDEAIQHRAEGINVPLMILGASEYEDAASLVKYDIIPAVYDFEFAEVMSSVAKAMRKTAKVHIKLDTGMSRIGFMV